MTGMELKLRRAELLLNYLNLLIELDKTTFGYKSEIEECIKAIKDDLQITRGYNGKTIQ
ncbi:hypothetical protein [Brevibacillus sp. VP]|uniref:hypothetical protein n=1 Tax=unclassified Brevibacillus TaxID=2684853 RepID=UPI001374BF03|nr:hypothetical protein [Brevibacillus sp. VP]